MTTTINASTSAGLVQTADTSGVLALQSAGTTFATGNQYGIGLGTAVPTSGIGISFPATQSASSDANTLDDYEEGTFTPVLASGGNTYGFQIGKYVKVGKAVTIIGSINVSSRTTSANIFAIGGLPFTADTTASSYLAVSVFPVSGFNRATATSYVGQLGFTTTQFSLYGVITSSGSNFLSMTMNDTGAVIEVEFAVTYISAT